MPHHFKKNSMSTVQQNEQAKDWFGLYDVTIEQDR